MPIRREISRSALEIFSTLLRARKLEQVKKDVRKAKLEIFGLSETRWKGKGDFIFNEFRIYNGKEKTRTNGVTIVLKGNWKHSV